MSAKGDALRGEVRRLTGGGSTLDDGVALIVTTKVSSEPTHETKLEDHRDILPLLFDRRQDH